MHQVSGYRFPWMSVSAWLAILLAGVGCKAVIDAEGFEVDPAIGDAGGSHDAAECALAADPPEDVVRSCTLLLSCAVHPETWSMSACVSRDLTSRFGLACLREAQECEDVWSCLGEGVETTRCAPGNTNHCDGFDDLVICDQEGDVDLDYWRHCPTMGAQQCAVSANKAGCQVTTACTGDLQCDGTTFFKCLEGGWGVGLDCSNFGKDCDPELGCRFVGEGACTMTESWCDGPDLVTCEQGRQYRSRCAAGLSCLSDGSGAECVAPGCSPADVDACEESCKGGTALNLCVGGASHTINCSKYGLGACEMTGKRVRCSRL